MIRVSELYVYPVKSCSGSAVPEASVGTTGFDLDRRWMVVDGDGVFLTQRKHPRMAMVRVRVGRDRLVIDAPGATDLEVPFADPGGPEVEVEVWNDTCLAGDEGAEAAEWFSDFFGFRARLARLAGDHVRPVGSAAARPGDWVSFADGFPFLLLSQESLDGLNQRLAEPLPMNRFRPNIVVSGCEAHAEDGWQRVKIGDLPFRVAKPCARCVVTTTDQVTGDRGAEPLRTLATYRLQGRQINFGQNIIHEGRGTLRVGDEVSVLS
jgi:uncharacterized protein YcbX